MKYLLCVFVGLMAISACKKELKPAPVQTNGKDTTIKTPVNTDTASTIDSGKLQHGDTTKLVDTFIIYHIKKGNNYCDGNYYPVDTYKVIHFMAILDSSCIYTTTAPVDQEDINKLYGFSDCNSHHQTNSARFGWNWARDSMRIHAYCYAGTIRSYKELGTVPVGKPFECRLSITPTSYVFELNGKTTTMIRGCSEPVANGYKLFPYFGGNEPAPHDINVRVKELKK